MTRQSVPSLGANPRYAAYAAAHGRTPDEMLAFDESRGVCMMEFVFWNTAMWKRWGLETGHPRGKDIYAIIRKQDHDDYDAWLVRTFRAVEQQEQSL